jgi:hypothetical protein
LNLLNDPVFFEAAQALGYRFEKASGSRIDFAFEAALGRKPSDQEKARLEQFVNAEPETTRWTALARVLLNTDEFIVRD